MALASGKGVFIFGVLYICTFCVLYTIKLKEKLESDLINPSVESQQHILFSAVVVSGQSAYNRESSLIEPCHLIESRSLNMMASSVFHLTLYFFFPEGDL